MFILITHLGEQVNHAIAVLDDLVALENAD